MLTVAEAVDPLPRGKAGDKPLVVADFTDNPGGGGYGDATAFLKGLIDAGSIASRFMPSAIPRR